MKKIIALWAFCLGAGFLLAVPAQAKTLFFDNMEAGEGDWTHSPVVDGYDDLWHLETNPEELTVHEELNPDLISLPDSGSLPAAYSGDSAWWYGDSETGTFIGDYTNSLQTDKNGGFSNSSNSGYLISPTIDLSNSSRATLTFWTWWEIEGVDVDRYDMMYVQASSDGSLYDTLGAVNPINDVDGESYKPYSSGGLGETGEWVKHTFSLDDFAGEESTNIRFYFDTVDHRYNAFRGWLIDNVRVTNKNSNKVPSFRSTVVAEQSCDELWGSDIQGAAFELASAQTLSVALKNADGFWITPFGTQDVAATGMNNKTVYLGAGKYMLYPDVTEDCADYETATAQLTYNKATPFPNTVQTDGSFIINGSKFNSESEVYLMGPKSEAGSVSATALTENQVEEVAVISDGQIEATLDGELAAGVYNLEIKNGNKKKTLKDAITITADAKPDMSSASPSTLSNDSTDTLSITGTDFADGAVFMIGNIPCSDSEVAVGGETATCVYPAGLNPGYQNLLIMNPDGQIDTLVGNLYITDASDAAFTPAGETLYFNKKVKSFAVQTINKTKTKVSWKKRAKAEQYQLEVRTKKGKLVSRRIIKKKKSSVWVKGLTPGAYYKARIRVIDMNEYSGPWTKWKSWQTNI